MIKINLLEVRGKKKQDTFKQQIFLAVLVILLALGVIGYFHTKIVKDIQNKKKEVGDVKTKIEKLNTEISKLQDYEKRRKNLEKIKSVIGDLEMERNGPVLIFAALSDVMPRQIWIEDFIQQGSKLTLNGYAADNETLANFIQSLEESKYFDNVILIKSEKSKSGSLAVNKFSLTMQIKYS